MKKKLDQHILDTMSKDLANWHGPFYCNRKDSRLLVPKYDSMLGCTFNFASPYAYITIIVIVLLIVGSQILL